MRSIKKITAALFAVCFLFAGCNSAAKDPETTTTAAKPDFSGAAVTEEVTEPAFADDGETISIYTGKEVENEEDLAIFKLSCEVPEGMVTLTESAEGKQYAAPFGGIIVKAQNYKEEFQELSVTADSGCASIKMANMLNQADTKFSDPINTTVAGFDAIRYDYTVTAYMYPPVTDANGEYEMNTEGQYILSEEREVYGEFVNRIYYFFSDEDVFYIICESTKEEAEAAAPVFDKFIESVKIN